VVREGAPVLRAVVAYERQPQAHTAPLPGKRRAPWRVCGAAAVATHAQVEGAVADAAVDAVVEAADLFAARRVKRRCSRPWEGPQPRRHSGGAAVAAGLGARQRVLSLLA